MGDHWHRASADRLCLQVAETLVTTDKEGALVPGLAERWSVSEDGLTWTFKLRDNAVFHDLVDGVDAS
ncbi:ABC transporter substrate-binding protein [Sinorhizobium meliloti]|uniref:ABC transporter substrate-binding protein n=1 Tax=Rhizobium meliloti TaxID=382 RepID=UPI003C6ECA02